MKKIEKFMLPENTNRLYKEEAISSIALTRDVAEKINEIIGALNELSKTDLEWKQIQEGSIRKGILYMKDNLVNSLHELLENLKANGFIDERIRENMGDLISELNVIASRFDNVVNGVTTDTEVIDIRVDANGVTQTSAGSQVRKIEKLVNGLLSNNINIYQGLNWTPSRAINVNGNVYVAGSENFKVSSVRLNKGTKVSYKLYGNASLPVIATGDNEKPLTIINRVADNGDATTPVIGEYTVINEAEVLWFSTTRLQDSNAYIKIVLPTNALYSWTKNYIGLDGALMTDNVYGVTDPIFVAKGKKISARLIASESVCAISKCDENGSFISRVRIG